MAAPCGGAADTNIKYEQTARSVAGRESRMNRIIPLLILTCVAFFVAWVGNGPLSAAAADKRNRQKPPQHANCSPLR